jgi:hypothetical protein
MVFARFQAIYGNRFDQMYNEDAALNRGKREWAQSIGNLTETQILQAIETSKNKCKWPPSIAEFLEFARLDPEQLGLLSERAAFAEACRCRQDPAEFKWSHPLVYWAAHETGFQTLKNAFESKSQPMFIENYRKFIQQWLNGRVFELPTQKFITQTTPQSFIDIQTMGKNLGLSDELSWKLLIYLEKPMGSASRKAFRQNAMKKVVELGLEIELPE